MRSFFFVVFFFLCFTPASFAVRPIDWPLGDTPERWLLGEGAYSVNLTPRYISSSTNYDLNGMNFTPGTMRSISAYPIQLNGALGISPSVSFFAQASTNYVSTLNSPDSNIPNGTNFDFADAFAAARFALNYQKNFQLLGEASWSFPVYGNSNSATKPPLGDQSNDFTGMLRSTYVPLAWLSFSGGLGYTFRSAGYSNEIPYLLRGDAKIPGFTKLRGFMEYTGYSSAKTDKTLISLSRLGIVPGGSFLYKGVNPSQALFGGGGGIGLGKDREWEIALAYHISVSGNYSANESIASLGISYRPKSSIPSSRTENELPANSITPNGHRPVTQYGYAAIIDKVSSRGNFIRIPVGFEAGVEVDDVFHIYNVLNPRPSPIARAKVVAVRSRTAFLHVEEYFHAKEKVNPGDEVRRVIPNE